MLQKLSIYLLILICFAIPSNAKEYFFVQNKGQFPASVQFVAELPGMNVWIENDRLKFEYFSLEKDTIKGQVLSLKFEDATSERIEIQTFKSSKMNILKGNDKSKWIKNIQTAESLLIKNLFPQIDLNLYIENEMLRYDYIVNENAKPSDIKFSFSGADYVFNSKNEIILGTSLGERKHNNLLAYQMIGNQRKIIPIEFESTGSNFKFILDSYDRNIPLIIDPLVYSTFMGGSDVDIAISIKKMPDSSLVVAGYSASPTYPTSDGSYQKYIKVTQFPETDAFVSKFSPTGKLLHSTFFGSYVEDKATDLAIDRDGNIYITGYSKNTITFPYTEAVFDSTHNGGYDSFVAKFDSTLENLIYATLVGGRKDDIAQCITVDMNGSPIISGYTTFINDSLFYPTTSNAFQRFYRGDYDGFITKFNSDCSQIVYSTLIGGSKDEYIQDLQAIADSAIYILGYTLSANFPVTSDAFQSQFKDNTINKEQGDAFLLCLNLNTNKIEYSTFIGGKNKDVAYAFRFDEFENVYIAGTSESDDFPVTANAFDRSFNDDANSKSKGDGFLMKFSNFGKNLLFSTFVGGSESDRIYDLDVYEDGTIFVTGSTSSINFPTTRLAYDISFNDTLTTDAFVTKFESNGSKLRYSTFLGGESRDIGWGIAVTNAENVYITGSTSSIEFPITMDAVDSYLENNTSTEAFFTYLKITLNEEDYPADYNICLGKSEIIESKWHSVLDLTSPDFTILWLPNQYINSITAVRPNCTPSALGIIDYYCTITNTVTSQVYLDTVRVQCVPMPTPDFSYPSNVVFGMQQKFQATSNSGSYYEWVVTNGKVVSGQGTSIAMIVFTADTATSVKLIETSTFGCLDSSIVKSIKVFYDAVPKIQYSGKIPKCSEDELIFDAGPYFSDIVWSNGVKGRYDTIKYSGKYYFTAKKYNGQSIVSDTINVTTVPSPPPPLIRYLDGEYRCLVVALQYQWYKDGVPIPGATERRYFTKDAGMYKVQIWASNGCSSISDELNSVELENIRKSILLYPNPNNGNFSIMIDNLEIGDLGLKISDINGTVLKEIPKYYVTSKTEIPISLEMFASGIYFLEFKSNKYTWIEKIIKE